MRHEDILAYFAKYIESQLGIVYSEQNYFHLQNRLEQICRLQGAADIATLYSTAREGMSAPFRQLLLDTATNNETTFFRDTKVFAAFEQCMRRIPSLHSRPLRIWSAACSTGQEPLSISMLIREYNLKTGDNVNFSILATDVCERALAKAQTGSYSQLEVQRGLPARMLIKYFSKDQQDNWTVSTDITKGIEFKKMNLRDPFNFSGQFDFILCRNVLIYHSLDSKKDIIRRASDCLSEDGYFFLGAGESLFGLSDAYELVSEEGAIVYKIKQELKKSA